MGNVYICLGSCNGVASEEQYLGGARACGASLCEHYKIPLEKRVQCASCNALFATDLQLHVCPRCGK